MHDWLYVIQVSFEGVTACATQCGSETVIPVTVDSPITERGVMAIQSLKSGK